MTVLKKLRVSLAATAACITLTAGAAFSEPPQPVPVGDASSEQEIRAALFGGVPGDRWKEGFSSRASGRLRG